MPSAWVQHVQSVYRKKKAKNAKYTYGQAMKDAKATYKKKGAAKAEKADAAQKGPSDDCKADGDRAAAQ